MADNVDYQTTTLATPPNATKVATDEAGVPARHYQLVKLVDGTADSETVIPGDGTNGLDVDVTRVQGTVTVGDGGGTLSVDDGTGSLTVDNATLAITGGGVEASALRVTLASDSTGVVSVDDNGASLTVDGTVTANAGIGPWPVTDNGGSLTVDGTVTANPTQPSTSTRTSVADAAVDTLILAANASRKGATVYNDSTSTLYLALGTTAATTTDFTSKLFQDDYYEVPAGYTGQIRGIWSADSTGSARITELA